MASQVALEPLPAGPATMRLPGADRGEDENLRISLPRTTARRRVRGREGPRARSFASRWLVPLHHEIEDGLKRFGPDAHSALQRVIHCVDQKGHDAEEDR